MNLSAPISYPEDTTEMQRIEPEEFREMLTTCNLAAELNRDKPNTATRNACKHMFARFKGERSRKIAYGASLQALPMAYIAKLMNRRNIVFNLPLRNRYINRRLWKL